MSRKGVIKPIPGLPPDLVEAIRLTIMGQEFINTGHIKNLAIDNAKIANLAVSTAKIQDLAVIEAKIDNLAVTNAKIGTAAITEAKIDNLAVTNAKIGALAVDAAKIADLAVETAKIANLAVAEGKIGALAVTSAKIASTIQSDNYVPDQAGWFINKDGKCEFGDVKVRGEIRASAFKYNTISAVGGKLVMSEATPLLADAAAVDTTLDVVDQAFQTNDLVHLQDVVGGAVQLEWMRILNNGTVITGGFRYTVTRNLDGSGANDWKKGTAVIEKGYSDGVSVYGGAWIELAGDEAGGELLQSFKRTGILYNAYTKQVWIDADGKLKAGGGDITQDDTGITLAAHLTLPTTTLIKWASGGHIFAWLGGEYAGISPNRTALAFLEALGEGSGKAILTLSAGPAPGLTLTLSTVDGRVKLIAPKVRLETENAWLEFFDGNTGLQRDASGNLTFKDVVAGTKTATQLASISQLGECSATLTLTVAHQDIAGCSLSLTAGTYIVMGFFAFRGDNQGAYAVGYLDVDGVEQGVQAQWRPAASAASAANVSQAWRITLASTKTVKLRANKNVDVGIFTAQAYYTNMVAIRTGD